MTGIALNLPASLGLEFYVFGVYNKNNSLVFLHERGHRDESQFKDIGSIGVPSLLFSSHVFYSVPPGASALMPGRIAQIAAISMSRNCDAGVMDQLCSSITNFLDEEAAKAGTSLKGCKTNCGWKKRKNDLITAARKKAKESCARGEAPDINDINKGLDGNAKTRLKNLYDNNSRMFDGTGKFAVKDLELVPSKQTALLAGKGGLAEVS